MEIDNLQFSYDQKKHTLQSIRSSIERGKVTTIIGPNGSGKSTLLGILSRNIQPQSGQIILDGKALSEYKAKELAKKLAVVHQQNIAPSDMTVETLTSYGRIPYRSLFSVDHEEDEKAIEWALTCTNLQDKRKKTLDSLSGGEKQRVWIAMALAQRTPYLFLDEPTTYLDIYYQYEILELIKQINEEQSISVVMVLHDINQAIRYSDRIIAMKDGAIVAQGAPRDMITADTIREIYGLEVMVKADEQAGLHIVPVGLSKK